MRPSRSQFWMPRHPFLRLDAPVLLVKPLACARLREDDQADQRRRGSGRRRESGAASDDLQDLVLDEPGEPHTVSPPVISRKTSSSVDAGRSTVKTSIPSASSARSASGTRSGGMRAVTTPSPSAGRRFARRRDRRIDRAERREPLCRPRRRRARTRTRSEAARAESSRTGPDASVRPRWMIATRSHVCSISESRWLETKTAIPRSAARRRTSCRISRMPAGIEAVGGLVEDEHVGVPEKRLRDPEPLAHARASTSRPCRPGAPRARPAPRAPRSGSLAPRGQHAREVLEILASRQVAVEVG